MWSAYSTAKLLFFLLLVDAALGRYIPANFTVNSTGAPIDWYPDGNVTLRWDIMDETRDSYTANVTIFNFMKNHDIEGAWELGWIWNEDEILLSSVGAKGRQHGNDPIDADRCCLNSVTFADLPPPTEQIVPNCCKGGVIPSWFRETDLTKSSSSFQISVGRVNVEFHPPPLYVNLTTPKSEYICEPVMEVTTTRSYLTTWRTECCLYYPTKFHYSSRFIT